MDSNRYGEQSHTPFRTRRLYSVNGQWYFDTREGKQFGPYREHKEAENALAHFVAENLREPNSSRPDEYGVTYGEQDGIEDMVEELLDYFHHRNSYGQIAALVWAKSRLKELILTQKKVANYKERMEVIKYAMDIE